MTTVPEASKQGPDDKPVDEFDMGVNWDLLRDLHEKPHPLLNIMEDFEAQIRETPLAWTGEVFQEARTAHHLLDLVGIPHGKGYASDLDARTYQAIRLIIDIRERLDRIKGWHSRESGPAGTVGDYCNDCGNVWPCDTYRMADGSYRDEEDLSDAEAVAALVDDRGVA